MIHVKDINIDRDRVILNVALLLKSMPPLVQEARYHSKSDALVAGCSRLFLHGIFFVTHNQVILLVIMKLVEDCDKTASPVQQVKIVKEMQGISEQFKEKVCLNISY